MSEINSADNRLLQRIQTSAANILAADKGKIGETIPPEILSCNYQEKTAVFRYKFHPWMLNCNNVMHGGCVALLMDSSMGWLSSAYPEQIQTTPSVSIQITYLNPIPLSDYIVVKVTLNAIKSRLIYANAAMYEESRPDVLLATAVGEYYRMSQTPPARS